MSHGPQSPMTIEASDRRYEIARHSELGVSRERIRQLQREAEEVLRDRGFGPEFPKTA